MPKAKKPVILIHGINSDGAWQEAAIRILAPHFKCHGYKHNHFKGIRTVSVAFEWSILVTVALLVLFIVLAPFSLLNHSYWAAIVAGLLAISWIAARRRYRTARDEFCRYLTLEKTEARPPHFIAHSFGTYLASSWMHRSPTNRSDRSIFCGSVLPSKLDWRQLDRQNRPKFSIIWNEIGRKDGVAWLAGAFAVVLPGLGSSGYRGFDQHIGKSRFIDAYSGTLALHNLKSAVLNIDFPMFEHSTAFDLPDHVMRVWLPVLWGFSPREYQTFLGLCMDAHDAEAEGKLDQLAIAEDELRHRTFGSVKTLAEALEGLLEERKALRGLGVRPPPDQVDRAVRLVWNQVAKAQRSFAHKSVKPMIYLDPYRAMVAAVEAIHKH